MTRRCRCSSLAGVYPIVTSRVPYETYIPDAYINAPDSGTWPMNCESGDGSDYWLLL